MTPNMNGPEHQVKVLQAIGGAWEPSGTGWNSSAEAFWRIYRDKGHLMYRCHWAVSTKFVDHLLAVAPEDIPRILTDTSYQFEKEILEDEALWEGVSSPSTTRDMWEKLHRTVVKPLFEYILETSEKAE